MVAKMLTLLERIYMSHGNPCDKAVPPIARHDEECWFYKQWSEEQMKEAVDAVITSQWSVRCAVMQYNVPKSSLGDRVGG